MTPSADQSAKILSAKLLAGETFQYVRLGDADVPWMLNRNRGSVTCDGEPWRPGLAADLMGAWRSLCHSPAFLCGDLLTMEDPAAPDVQCDFLELCHPYPDLQMLHSEALLIHRLSPALRDFYRTLRNVSRRKVFVGPVRLEAAAEFLGADFIAIHSTHAHESGEMDQTLSMLEGRPVDIAIVVGGRASKLLAGWLAVREKTVVELGSALDPLFYGRTRSAQIDPGEARAYFAGMWWGV
jgi:hypothetical protein